VARLERLAMFRGPASAQHRPKSVAASLEVAKSMRGTHCLPGTEGFQRDFVRCATSARLRRGDSCGRGADSSHASSHDGASHARERDASAHSLLHGQKSFSRHALRESPLQRPTGCQPVGLPTNL